MKTETKVLAALEELGYKDFGKFLTDHLHLPLARMAKKLNISYWTFRKFHHDYVEHKKMEREDERRRGF